MFVLSLPKECPHEGKCRINGREATYRLRLDRIEYRHGEDGLWKTRNILHIGQSDNGLNTYICDDGPTWDDMTETTGRRPDDGLIRRTAQRLGLIVHKGRKDGRWHIANRHDLLLSDRNGLDDEGAEKWLREWEEQEGRS